MKIKVFFLADICIFIKQFIKLFHSGFNVCSLTTQNVRISWPSELAKLSHGWLEVAQSFLLIGKMEQCQRLNFNRQFPIAICLPYFQISLQYLRGQQNKNYLHKHTSIIGTLRGPGISYSGMHSWFGHYGLCCICI